MLITIKSIETDQPVPGVPVSVDGGSPQSTDANGQVNGPSGTTVHVHGHAKFVFADVEDREIWIEAMGSPPPPPPLPPPPPPGGSLPPPIPSP